MLSIYLCMSVYLLSEFVKKLWMTITTTFYVPLIQDNPGEPVPETVGHINPYYHHYPPQ